MILGFTLMFVGAMVFILGIVLTSRRRGHAAGADLRAGPSAEGTAWVPRVLMALGAVAVVTGGWMVRSNVEEARQETVRRIRESRTRVFRDEATRRFVGLPFTIEMPQDELASLAKDYVAANLTVGEASWFVEGRAPEECYSGEDDRLDLVMLCVQGGTVWVTLIYRASDWAGSSAAPGFEEFKDSPVFSGHRKALEKFENYLRARGIEFTTGKPALFRLEQDGFQRVK